MQKFWIELHGVVGTAHVSRRGAVVDFRPHGGFSAEDRNGRFATLILLPPRGQEGAVKPLRLPASVDVADGPVNERGKVLRTTTFTAQYGVPLTHTVSHEVRIWTEEDRERATAATEGAMAGAEFRRRELLNMIPVEFWALAAPNARERGRLRRREGRWEGMMLTLARRVSGEYTSPLNQRIGTLRDWYLFQGDGRRAPHPVVGQDVADYWGSWF